MTLISALAEMVSLGAVLPFIGIIVQPEKALSNPLLAKIAGGLDIGTADELVVPLALAFGLAALLAGGVRLILLWFSIRLGNETGADISVDVYRRTLYQDYSVHIGRNSSELIGGITQKVSAVTSILISMVSVITSGVIFSAIVIALILIDPMISVFVILIFGCAYGCIAWSTRKILLRNGHQIAMGQTQVIRTLQEGLGSIRDVLLDGTQEVYSNTFKKSILRLQRASTENTFINQAPRFAVEALAMALIVVFVLTTSHRAGGVVASFPILAAFALGAQRLLPLMQQFYGNWSVLMGGRTALVEVLTLLEQPLPVEISQELNEPVRFSRSIEFNKVSYRYKESSPFVLDDINLTILRGSRVGIIGSTGSGKSTMLDLLMGLIQPTSGSIKIDGKVLESNSMRAWRKNVAHVPQSIFLSDASILENIAFGVPLNEINFNRVQKAAEQAQISEFIDNTAEGYIALVGERGVRLSGGQRQRIGIARALYKEAQILVLDEATSALDSETERAVMQNVQRLNKDITLFIIAHRLTTLKDCDVIIELRDSRIIWTGSYDQISKETEII